MTFESYLHDLRRYEVRAAKLNPEYADVELEQLQRHVRAVQKWIDGDVDRKAMASAMRYFRGRYRATGKVYRGMRTLAHFDGKPASYTKEKWVAEDFGEMQSTGKGFFVVEREAPANSIDLGKMLKAYATCGIKFCKESEVVLLNTEVPASSITEYTQ